MAWAGRDLKDHLVPTSCRGWGLELPTAQLISEYAQFWMLIRIALLEYLYDLQSFFQFPFPHNALSQYGEKPSCYFSKRTRLEYKQKWKAWLVKDTFLLRLKKKKKIVFRPELDLSQEYVDMKQCNFALSALRIIRNLCLSTPGGILRWLFLT